MAGPSAAAPLRRRRLAGREDAAATRGCSQARARGVPDERPPHEVTLAAAFFIGKHELSQVAWRPLHELRRWPQNTAMDRWAARLAKSGFAKPKKHWFLIADASEMQQQAALVLSPAHSLVHSSFHPFYHPHHPHDPRRPTRL